MKNLIVPLSPEYYKLSKEERITLAVDRLDQVFVSMHAYVKHTTTVGAHRAAIIVELTSIIDAASKNEKLMELMEAVSAQPEGWMMCDEALGHLFELMQTILQGIATKTLNSPLVITATIMLSHMSLTLTKIFPELLGIGPIEEKKATELPKMTEKQLALN